MARSRASCVVSKSTGTESPWKEIGGPSVDLRAPSVRQPIGRSAGADRSLGPVVHPAAPAGGLGGGVAGDGAAAGVETCELARGLRAGALERGAQLLLDDGERLERQPRGGRRRAEGGGDADALGGRCGELVPAALGRERALGVGAREDLGPAVHQAAAIWAQASRSSDSSSLTFSIISGSRAMRAS